MRESVRVFCYSTVKQGTSHAFSPSPNFEEILSFVVVPSSNARPQFPSSYPYLCVRGPACVRARQFNLLYSISVHLQFAELKCTFLLRDQ